MTHTPRLIAAAPELLEALYMVLPYVECELERPGYKVGTKNMVLGRIRDAINKAEGE